MQLTRLASAPLAPPPSVDDAPPGAPVVRSLLIASAVASVLFLALVPVAWHRTHIGTIDRWAFDANLPTNRGLFDLGRVLSALGSAAVLAVGAVLIVTYLLRRPHRPWLAAGASLALVVSSAGQLVAKAIIARPRPITAALTGEAGNGFPSGHTSTATAFAVAAALAIACTRRHPVTPARGAIFAGAGVVFGLFVAVGRVLVGAHYVTDTVAGLAFGTAVACAAMALALLGESRRGERARPVGER